MYLSIAGKLYSTMLNLEILSVFVSFDGAISKITERRMIWWRGNDELQEIQRRWSPLYLRRCSSTALPQWLLTLPPLAPFGSGSHTTDR